MEVNVLNVSILYILKKSRKLTNGSFFYMNGHL